jgi:predicted phosphodiesterase
VLAYIAEHGYPDNVSAVARQLATELGCTAHSVDCAFSVASTAGWHHSEGVYTFELPGGRTLVVPNDDVAKWVRLYVHDGENQRLRDVVMVAIEDGHVITYGEMRKVFSVLEVYKSTPPFAPHETAERTVDSMVSEQRERVEARVQRRYVDGEPKRWKSKWLKERRATLDLGVLVEAVLESGYLPELPSASYEPSEPQTILLATDWHVGYRTDVLRERVAILARERVDIVCFGGDILDGPQGNMRGHQLSEQDLHFEQQVLEAISLMTFLVRSVGARQVYCVTGNHDRTSPDRKDDPRRLVGRLAYLAAAERTPDVVWTLAEQDVVTFDVETTRVVLSHGDKAKPRNLVWAHRSPGLQHHLVLHGHLHHLSVEEDGDTLIVGGGSMVGRGEAAERLGRWARPSQVILEVGPLGPGIRKTVVFP